MEIRTITCHDVYNYGASLQAYALQYFLEKEGNEVKIINYKPDYLSHHYQWRYIANPRFDKPLLRQLYRLAKFPSYFFSLKRKEKFDEFTSKFLDCTSEIYHSNNELKENLPEADLYIAGSDQIWNTLFPNGKDPAFYLDFVPKDRIKISYAASFATQNIANGYEDFVQKHIKYLDYVSVREQSGLNTLKALGINSGIHVCDPVFLLSKEEWMHLSELSDYKLPQHYILVYDFDNNPEVIKWAKRLARKQKLEILYINSSFNLLKKNIFGNTGPLEFLSLILHADFVLSNSFHALAFCLIFEKNFYVTCRKEGINERMISLLKQLNLDFLLLKNLSDDKISNIDYNQVKPKLKIFISESIHYLKQIQTYI